MRGLLAVQALVLGLAGAPEPVVTPQRVGALRIGATTGRALLAVAGRPIHSEPIVSYGPFIVVVGRALEFRCPGRGCRSWFTIGLDGRIHDFQTTSSGYRTAHGTRIGMTVAHAEVLEGGLFRNGCPGLVLSVAPGLELISYRGLTVDAMLLLGPDSLYLDGDC
jgi:hypothetical protein